MTEFKKLFLPDEHATEALGAALGQSLAGAINVYLHGDLGAGKTTLVRGLLRGLGHKGAVRSPTYTLMEPYDLAGMRLLHLDLYRLGDPEELEYLGLREEVGEAVLLVEWPERGQAWLPRPDLSVSLAYQGAGRVAELRATGTGREVLGRLAARASLNES